MTLNRRMTVTAAAACVLVSTVLYTVFSDSLWFFIGAGAVIAVAATGALTRLRTLPVPACLAASLAGLLLYLNLIFEARHSLLFVIPTPTSITRLFRARGHRGARIERSCAAGAEPARPAAAGRRRDRHRRGGDRPDRGAAAVRRAGRAAVARPVHRAGHGRRAIGPAEHGRGVLRRRGGIPGYAQRRRPGTDPRLGPSGFLVARGIALRTPTLGTDVRDARAGSGHPGAGRGGPPGRTRLDRAGAVRAAAAARPAPEQAVLLGPGHRWSRRPRQRRPRAAWSAVQNHLGPA